MFDNIPAILIAVICVNIAAFFYVWKLFGARINVLISRKEEKDLIFGKFYLYAPILLNVVASFIIPP